MDQCIGLLNVHPSPIVSTKKIPGSLQHHNESKRKHLPSDGLGQLKQLAIVGIEFVRGPKSNFFTVLRFGSTRCPNQVLRTGLPHATLSARRGEF